MVRRVNSEIKLCADCPNGVMRKMPGLSEIYMCTTCSGVNYRIPAEWEMPEENDDDALYREETSGE